jgi:hypothetical protein
MTRWAAAWVPCAALAACTPIYTEPDAGPTNQLLFAGVSRPTLGAIASEPPVGSPSGPCSLRITNLQVSSSNPDAGGAIVASAYLNLNYQPIPPSPNNNLPLPLFSQLPFTLVGPGTGSPPLFEYAPRQLPIVIGLDSLQVISLLWPRTSGQTNYLTLKVTDGVTSLDLIWGVDFSKCDPRPF